MNIIIINFRESFLKIFLIYAEFSVVLKGSATEYMEIIEEQKSVHSQFMHCVLVFVIY